MSDIFGILCLVTYGVVVGFSIKRDDPLLLAFALSFLVLYVGQYFALDYLYSSQPVIRTLDSWGYTDLAASLLHIYLIYIGVILLCFVSFFDQKKGALEIKSQSIASQNLFHFVMIVMACMIYVLIVGLDGLFSVRPNFIQGGTFGSVLILSFGLCVNVMLFSRSVSFTVYIGLLLLSLLMLMMSGTRIYVIYLLGTSALIIHRRYHLRLGPGLFILSALSAFLVLILGQSVKEYFGGNLDFEDYVAAVSWTINNFYVSQVEGFSASASIIQKTIDIGSLPFNLGINAMGSLLLLLPGFIRPKLEIPISQFVFYDQSIVPPAVESFIEYFGPLSVFLHGFALLWVLNFYRNTRAMQVRTRLGAYVLIYKLYLVVSSMVLLTRGPVDLIWFTLIPPAFFMYAHYLFGSTLFKKTR